MTDRSADWLSIDRDRIVFGSGHRLNVEPSGSEITVNAPVSGAVLVGDQLYVAQESTLSVLDLAAPGSEPAPLALAPGVEGALRVARMTDHLVVAENGFGLRWVALPPPAEMVAAMGESHAHHGPTGPHQISTLPMDERFTAIAASGPWVYAAVDGKGVVVVDAANPFEPEIVRDVPVVHDVNALAANGSLVYVLGSRSLSVLNLSDLESPIVDGSYPGIGGSGLHVAGRLLHLVAEEGILALHDQSPAAGLHRVTVGDFFFSPNSMSVNIGDTVDWNWSGVFGHNVVSCDGAPPPTAINYCAANPLAAEGSFTSGLPVAAPNNFSQMFTVVGPNPYFCRPHVAANPPFGMVGSITVNAGAGPPPGVPDSSPGLLVDKVTPSGGRLLLTWDRNTCNGDCDHQIVHGLAAGLPTYTLTSSANQCAIGSSPYQWNSVPNPNPQPYLWFMVVANDCATTEGSWGKNSGGGERNGAGASGQCGSTVKDLTNLCGQ